MPINIHLTGCPNSCAQHYIGDIGLLGTKVAVGEDMVEGYHVFVGGGYGADQDIGREIYRDVMAEDAPAVIERMLRATWPHGSAPTSRSATSSSVTPPNSSRTLFACSETSASRLIVP